jgi:hypothetical protein
MALEEFPKQRDFRAYDILQAEKLDLSPENYQVAESTLSWLHDEGFHAMAPAAFAKPFARSLVEPKKALQNLLVPCCKAAFKSRIGKTMGSPLIAIGSRRRGAETVRRP